MDPFDPAMVEVQGLHAVSSTAVATQVGLRQLGRKSYPMFYNPMWSHMGDGWQRPPGTYYFKTSNVDRQYFHTLDQVLVRPSLASLLTQGSIRILTRDGANQFASPVDDIPIKGRVSDHLPVHLDHSL